MKISEKTVIALIPLESAVLDAIANQLDEHDREILIKQFERAIILSRQMTGHGFFTNFKVMDENAARLSKSGNVGNITADITGLTGFVGFTVLIKKGGIVENLEGFCFGDMNWPDPWPSDNTFKIREESRRR